MVFVVVFFPVVGGASFADIGQALDEILSFSADVGEEETEEHFSSVQAHKDVVIACCWLRIKVRSWALSCLIIVHGRICDWCL